MNSFVKFKSRTLIQGIFETETALTIGGRASLDPTGTDLPVVKTAEGVPFLPGSSIKGVIRVQMERVLRSINKRPDFWSCEEPFDSKYRCGDNAERKEQESEEAFSRRVWESSCTVCRLFGSPSFASRLFFKDAPLRNLDALQVVTQIRDGVGIDRDLGAARSHIKYDFEVVVPGAQFEVEILAENVEEWELGLLLAVLRPWEEGHMPIGGKSSRGPGWGKLCNLVIQRVEEQDLLSYLTQGRMSTVDAQKFLRIFQQKVQSEGESYA